MKRHVFRTLMVAALLPPAIALAQEPGGGGPELSAAEPSVRALEELRAAFPGPLPESLPELIELAQDRSPAVRIAEAKLQEAEAELRQVRNEVAQQVVELWRRKQSIPYSEYTEAGQKAAGVFAERQRQLADVELELRSSLGFSIGPEREPEHPPRPEFRAGRPPMPEGDAQLLQMLKAPVSIDFSEMAVPLSEVLNFLVDYAGFNLVMDVVMPDPVIRIQVSDVPLAGCLQAIADQAPPLCFVIRDDYILATTRERAMTIKAPTIPADVPLFVDTPPERAMQNLE